MLLFSGSSFFSKVPTNWGGAYELASLPYSLPPHLGGGSFLHSLVRLFGALGTSSPHPICFPFCVCTFFFACASWFSSACTSFRFFLAYFVDFFFWFSIRSCSSCSSPLSYPGFGGCAWVGCGCPFLFWGAFFLPLFVHYFRIWRSHVRCLAAYYCFPDDEHIPLDRSAAPLLLDSARSEYRRMIEYVCGLFPHAAGVPPVVGYPHLVLYLNLFLLCCACFTVLGVQLV